ncbi:hypothetical protein FQZ97_762230 [compost metagenome]
MTSLRLSEWTYEMKIKTTLFVLLGVALFVVVSIGLLPARSANLQSATAISCPYPNYPCGNLPAGFTGWPRLP